MAPRNRDRGEDEPEAPKIEEDGVDGETERRATATRIRGYKGERDGRAQGKEEQIPARGKENETVGSRKRGEHKETGTEVFREGD